MIYPFYIFIAFLFGSAIGSFLNVVVYRLPRKESLISPGSRCPSCGSPIQWYDNIPIVSYILLGGKCRNCYGKISLRYPLVEFSTGLMVTVLYVLHGFSFQFLSDVVFVSLLVTAALIDFDYMIIPNRLTFPGMIAGMAFSLQWGMFGFWRAVHGAIVGVLILMFMYFLGKLLFKREGIGMGDVKLAVVIGFFTGPFWTTAALVIAILAGGTGGIAQLIAGKKIRGREIPFGPFIAFGGLCIVFFRQQILFCVEQYVRML